MVTFGQDNARLIAPDTAGVGQCRPHQHTVVINRNGGVSLCGTVDGWLRIVGQPVGDGADVGRGVIVNTGDYWGIRYARIRCNHACGSPVVPRFILRINQKRLAAGLRWRERHGKVPETVCGRGS